MWSKGKSIYEKENICYLDARFIGDIFIWLLWQETWQPVNIKAQHRGVKKLQQLTDAGVDVDTAAKSIKFNMGISENYFMELAKFRAARLLWA